LSTIATGGRPAATTLFENLSEGMSGIATVILITG
jgi:hypothetical protein